MDLVSDDAIRISFRKFLCFLSEKNKMEREKWALYIYKNYI